MIFNIGKDYLVPGEPHPDMFDVTSIKWRVALGRCIECGCRHDNACVSNNGLPCHWSIFKDGHGHSDYGVGLCSACRENISVSDEALRLLFYRALLYKHPNDPAGDKQRWRRALHEAEHSLSLVRLGAA